MGSNADMSPRDYYCAGKYLIEGLTYTSDESELVRSGERVRDWNDNLRRLAEELTALYEHVGACEDFSQIDVYISLLTECYDRIVALYVEEADIHPGNFAVIAAAGECREMIMSVGRSNEGWQRLHGEALRSAVATEGVLENYKEYLFELSTSDDIASVEDTQRKVGFLVDYMQSLFEEEQTDAPTL